MGRRSSIDDETLIVRLAEVFRVAGYEGASLADLSRHAGLQRASLYHRFPQGKPAMAEAVLDDVGRQFTTILEPLRSEGDLRAAVVTMATRIKQFYDDGRLACVLDTMTLRGAPEHIRLQATNLARVWIDAMADVAVRAGATPEEAQRRSRTSLVAIEGSLVTSRVFDDASDFERALAELPHRLLS